MAERCLRLSGFGPHLFKVRASSEFRLGFVSKARIPIINSVQCGIKCECDSVFENRMLDSDFRTPRDGSVARHRHARENRDVARDHLASEAARRSPRRRLEKATRSSCVRSVRKASHVHIQRTLAAVAIANDDAQQLRAGLATAIFGQGSPRFAERAGLRAPMEVEL